MLQTEISITGEPISDATCRFTVDRPVYPDKSFAFLSKEAAESSPLAQRLFEIDGITRVLISHDQITINKSAQADWPVIGKSIGAAIRAHLATDDPAVSDAAWENVPSSDEIRDHVQQVLDTEINPSVAEHGGVIRLIDVKGEPGVYPDGWRLSGLWASGCHVEIWNRKRDSCSRYGRG